DDAAHAQLMEDGADVARRADAEVAAGDEDVARLHFVDPSRSVGLEAVGYLLLERPHDREVGDHQVGVDVVAELPDSAAEGVRHGCRAPFVAQRSRGSVITPVTADAATVAGEPM